MARSLPLYIATAELEVTLTDSEAGTATAILAEDGGSCAGMLLRGVAGAITSTGGKVTVNIYDQATIAQARQYYSVELDFTSLTQTSDTQDPGIPILVDPYVTITGDATANTKDFFLLVYAQKIGVEGSS